MERSIEYQRPIYMCFIDYTKHLTALTTQRYEMGCKKLVYQNIMVHVIRSL